MKLEDAEALAAVFLERITPYCRKAVIAGSIRRRKPLVNDVDIVLIPSDPWGLQAELKKFTTKAKGEKLARVQYRGTQFDLYIATEDTFEMLLLIRTGSAENNIRLASLAKKQGWRLAASGDGLFDENGKRLAGDSERSIYEALGLRYQEPWER